MIDLHSHILPGVDDGVPTIGEALALAEEAVAAGTTHMAATPHVRSDYPTAPETMESCVTDLRRRLGERGVDLEILTGGEIDIAMVGAMSHETLGRFSLAGSGRYVLVEFPYTGWPLALEGAVSRLRALGMTALLAHPERNPAVQAQPELLAPLVEAGVLVQVTGASLGGRLGHASRAAARSLLKLGLVHVLASDAHGSGADAAGLAMADAMVGDEALARYLTFDAPRAIIVGEPVPAAPRVGGRRGFPRLLSRGGRPAAQPELRE